MQSTINHFLRLHLLFLVILLIGCEGETSEEMSTEFAKPGVYDVSVKVDTMTRWFKLNIPEGYDHLSPTPLLMVFHGGNLSMGYMQNNRTDIIDRCVQENWILVFPNGANAEGNRGAATWNAVHCCNPALFHNVNDLAFVEKIVDTLRQELTIDSDRVYAMGGSNGGMLAHKMAAELPHILTAVAANSGTIGGRKDETSPIEMIDPRQPIPFLLIHGMVDQKVKFTGGWSSGSDRYDISFQESTKFWASVNQCDLTQPDTTLVQGLNGKVWIVDFDNCNSNTGVRGIAIENKGHGWPGLEQSGFDGTNAMIDFLKEHSK